MEMALDRLKAVPGYVAGFKEVFGTPPTPEGIAKAIAAFERTVVSTDSAYDKFARGDKAALDPAALRGLGIFEGKGRCVSCHRGANFTDGSFHNVGIGFKDGKLADEGRFGVTKDPGDMGAFKTPGLRSVALAPPFFHDGSVKTLEEAVAAMAGGGVANPSLDPMLAPRNLTAAEKADLTALLKALTGAPLKIAKPDLPK
jgi:cytochrome c peroxidase